jgi:phosphoribosyl 1,2-cyclic phosphate phosphodiesterase
MTHAHADHTGGFDDLRRFNEILQAHIPVYANAGTAEMLRDRYAYAFEDVFPFYGGKPDLILHEADGPFDLFGQTVVPVPVLHGRLPIFGYRFADLAYVTDAKTIPPKSMELLQDLDVLVLNGLREKSAPTHLSFAEAVDIIRDLRPRRAFLIHLSHATSHADAQALMPDGVEIAWDGLVVSTGADLMMAEEREDSLLAATSD